jgi:hypothetical protein
MKTIHLPGRWSHDDGEIRPLKLVDVPSTPRRTSQDGWKRVNLTGTSIPSLGGLTLIVLGTLVTLMRPEAWWFVLAAVSVGIVFGVALVTRSRRRGLPEHTAFFISRSL